MHTRFYQLFLRATAVVTLGNACAYGLQILFARSLGTAEFGAVNSVLALAMIVSAPIVALPLIIGRAFLVAGQHVPYQAWIARRSLAWVTAGVCLVVVACTVFAPKVRDHLGISGFSAVALLPLLITSIYLANVPIGIWQGLGQYHKQALATAAVPAIRFIVALALLVLALRSVEAAIIALSAGGVFVFIVGLADLRRLAHPEPQAPPSIKHLWRFGVLQTVAALALTGLSYIDIVLVRAIADPTESGLYAAASTLAKICLLLPAALVGIVAPEASRNALASPDRPAAPHIIATGLLFTALLSGAAAVVFVAAPALCLQLFAGQGYTAAAGLLQLTAPAMALLAIVTLVVTYSISLDSTRLLIPLVLALPAFCIVTVGFRLTPKDVAVALMALTLALALDCCAWLFRQSRRPA